MLPSRRAAFSMTRSPWQRMTKGLPGLSRQLRSAAGASPLRLHVHVVWQIPPVVGEAAAQQQPDRLAVVLVQPLLLGHAGRPVGWGARDEGEVVLVLPGLP